VKDRTSVTECEAQCSARAKLSASRGIPGPVFPMRTELLCVSMLLVACNGGDHPVAPIPTTQITAANAVAVASAAVRASLGLADVAGIAARVMTAVPAGLGAGTALPGTIMVTIPGAQGGEALRTLDDRDDDQRVSTGDGMTIDFMAFGEAGLVLDGVVSVQDLVVQGDLVESLNWIVRTRLDFIDLVVTSSSGPETLNGSLWCTREKRDTVFTLELDADQVFDVDGNVLAAGTTLAYPEFRLDGTFAQFGAGAVESEAIGGVVLFEVKVPFMGFQVVPNPNVGELEVRGADGSMLTVRAVDFDNAEIAVDADGDGVAEQTIPIAWSAL